MFRSFFLAGFECATGFNMHHRWIDQVAATQHDRFVEDDYRLLRATGIGGARDAIRWPLVDRRGAYDFSTALPLIRASREHGVDVIYDLFHYGYPEDVDLFSEEFPGRFAEYCYSAARFISARSPGPYYFTPLNEPSYFSWAAGEVGRFAPHVTGRGFELKVNLVRAAIQGIDAIRSAVPDARIVNADALCRVVPPLGQPELEQACDDFNGNAVFQSFEMLSGRMLPELGGSPAHLDIVGLNYYWTNQWELNRSGVPLGDDDPRRWSLSRLVRSVWERYAAQIVISETSHVGEMRPIWMRALAREAEALLAGGVALRGICLYPVLGMPEWHAPDHWTRMGLWDLIPNSDGTLARVPYTPMLEALREAQRRLGDGIRLLSRDAKPTTRSGAEPMQRAA
jgi:hypothetical protein